VEIPEGSQSEISEPKPYRARGTGSSNPFPSSGE